MKRKVLFLATYGDFLATFELSNIQLLLSLGWEVHCASDFLAKDYNRKSKNMDGMGIIKHQVEFKRNPFQYQNFRVYKQLKNIILSEHIEMIDCHNAVVGAIARLAAKRCGVKYVVYTPHSFFFYKGCSLKNKLIFKNVETFLARYTDLLVTINQEDFLSAHKMPLRGKAIYVQGIGIDVEEIRKVPTEREHYRKEFHIPPDSFVFINVGEMIPRKNQVSILRAFSKANINNAYLIICGIGQLHDSLRLEAEQLNLRDKVIFTGYRTDVKQLMKAADAFVFASFQEGLSVALMEAMAAGLPCLVSEIRGNTDLVEDGKGGWLFPPTDTALLSCKMKELASDEKLRENMRRFNEQKIQSFDIHNVRAFMLDAYQKLTENESRSFSAT